MNEVIWQWELGCGSFYRQGLEGGGGAEMFKNAETSEGLKKIFKKLSLQVQSPM